MARNGSAVTKCICSGIGTLRGWAMRIGSKASLVCVKRERRDLRLLRKAFPRHDGGSGTGRSPLWGHLQDIKPLISSSRRQGEEHPDWEMQVQGNEVIEELPSFREFPNSPWKAEQAAEPQLQWNSKRHWVSRARAWETGIQPQTPKWLESTWEAFQVPCRIPHLVFSAGDKEDLTRTIDPSLPPSSILPSLSITNTCPKNISSQCHDSFMYSWKSRSCGLCMASPFPGANFSRFINRITTAEKKSHSRSFLLLPVNSLL